MGEYGCKVLLVDVMEFCSALAQWKNMQSYAEYKRMLVFFQCRHPEFMGKK